MFHTMTTTMDSAGRLVIPREVRREASLEPGVPLRVRVRDGIVEIEPEPLPVRLERKGRLLVASPVRRVGRLRATTVERTRRDIAGPRTRR
jgi:AbrB family looped-hinge helix DNA binding protein